MLILYRLMTRIALSDKDLESPVNAKYVNFFQAKIWYTNRSYNKPRHFQTLGIPDICKYFKRFKY